MASISAPGSTLALNFLLESGFRRLLDRSAASQNEHAQTTSSAVREANGQPSSFNFAEGTPNIISDGKDSSNIVGRKKSSLLSQFRWACPDDSKQVSLYSSASGTSDSFQWRSLPKLKCNDNEHLRCQQSLSVRSLQGTFVCQCGCVAQVGADSTAYTVPCQHSQLAVTAGDISSLACLVACRAIIIRRSD